MWFLCGILGEMNTRLGQFLPKSRKARFILACLVVLALVIATILAIAARQKQKPPVFDGKIALNLREDQLARLRQDSDSDELKDWEEILYHTDPRNPDTDGDGTPDGEEVRQGRDPTKPNTSKDTKKPNDYFAAAAPLADSAAPAGAAPNLTADFTRTFLRGPLAQMLAGTEPQVDTKGVERYADRLKGNSVLADAPRFTATDIKINPATDDQTIVQYFAAVKETFRLLSSSRGRNELDIVADALINQDYSGTAELAPYPDAYQKAINNLKALHAPKDFSDYHLALLNYLSKFKRSVELLQKIESDPILGILTINERLKLNDELAASLNRFKEKTLTESKK